jgi:hypothetical protein
MAIQVKCINKSDRCNPHERIINIGGTNPDGTRWKLSQPEAIKGIENGTYQFYVSRPAGDSVWVIVAVSQYGNKYLKTESDGDQPNNLLSLPECPLAQRYARLGSRPEAQQSSQGLSPS